MIDGYLLHFQIMPVRSYEHDWRFHSARVTLLLNFGDIAFIPSCIKISKIRQKNIYILKLGKVNIDRNFEFEFF